MSNCSNCAWPLQATTGFGNRSATMTCIKRRTVEYAVVSSPSRKPSRKSQSSSDSEWPCWTRRGYIFYRSCAQPGRLATSFTLITTRFKSMPLYAHPPKILKVCFTNPHPLAPNHHKIQKNAERYSRSQDPISVYLTVIFFWRIKSSLSSSPFTTREVSPCTK